MSDPDDPDKEAGQTTRMGSNLVTRTLPSIDLEALREYHQRSSSGNRPGTVQLNVDLAQAVERTPEKPLHPVPLENAGGQPRDEEVSVARRQILAGAAAIPGASASSPTPFGIDRLLELLAGEAPPAGEALYLAPNAGDPFDGLMNQTLEMKIDPSIFAATPEKKKSSDADFAWLSPPEPPRPLLANAYGLSDTDVARACLPLYRGLEPVQGEGLMVVGQITRLEAFIVDSFVPLGRQWAALVDRLAQPDSDPLRALIEPSGALRDPDITQALRHWKEDRHDARFWADDDGTRLKAIRLVGAYLLRKQGTALARIPRPPPINEPILHRLLTLVDSVRHALNERQALIRRHFATQSNAFTTTFLVHRGLNARPGFFWLENVREEL